MTSYDAFDGTAVRQFYPDPGDPVDTPEPGHFSDVVPLRIPRVRRRELRRRMDNDRTDTDVDSEEKVWQSRVDENNLAEEGQTTILEESQDPEIELVREQVHILQEAVSRMMNRQEAFKRMGIGFGVPLAVTCASISGLVVGSLTGDSSLSQYIWIALCGFAFGIPTMLGTLVYVFTGGEN